MTETPSTKRTPRARFIDNMRRADSAIFHADWCPTPTSRKITRKNSVGVYLAHPTKPDVDSFLDWPKASEVSEESPGVFRIQFTHSPAPLFYSFLEETTE